MEEEPKVRADNYIQTQINIFSIVNNGVGEKKKEEDASPVVAAEDVDFEPVETRALIESHAESIKGMFYGNADVAAKFLDEIRGLKPLHVTEVVGKYVNERRMSELFSHRSLWKFLHDNGYYYACESNWNKALRLL